MTWQPGPGGESLQQEGAAGGGRRVLQNDDVAGGERGRQRPHNLPVREVPRHDCEHHTQWVVAHVTAHRFGLDGFRLQHCGGVLGEPLAGPRALVDLGQAVG